MKKTTPERFVAHLKRIRNYEFRTDWDGSCIVSGFVGNKVCHEIYLSLMVKLTGSSMNFLFKPNDWRTRDMFLDMFIGALNNKYKLK